MADEGATPDLIELVRQSVEAASERDMDGIMACYASDAVWDMSPIGVGTFTGHAEARRFFEDWFASYEEYGMEAEEILDLGNGVAFAVILQKGRPVGSTGYVELRLRVRRRVGGAQDRPRDPTIPKSTRAVLPPNASRRSGLRYVRGVHDPRPGGADPTGDQRLESPRR
jgi:hypothetical protein